MQGIRRLTLPCACAIALLAPQSALAAGPPVVTLGGLTATGATTEHVEGSLRPGSQDTNYHYEYGLGGTAWCASNGTSGPAPNSTSPVHLLASDNAEYDASTDLSSLSSGADYCVRLVASNTSGDDATDTEIFTAGDVPPPPGPTAVTGGVSNVTSGSAVLHGTVNPGGESTEYQFWFGSDSSGFCMTGSGTPHGTSIANVGFTDNSPHAVSAQISGLLPSTGYCYQLLAENSSDTSGGAKAEFATLPGPLPGSGGPSGGGGHEQHSAKAARISRAASARVRASGRRLVVDSGIKVACPAGAGPCKGSGKVVAKRKVLGKRSLKIASGRSSRVRIALSSKGAGLLRRRGKLRVTITVTVKTKSGKVSKAPRKVTLKAPKKHH
jgi:hypothetical protein